MPIRRFRSIEDMKTLRWRDPGDPGLFRAIRRLWEIAARTRTRTWPPGVHKHASIEDMQLAQEQWAKRPSS
jgi:hypothetical protein